MALTTEQFETLKQRLGEAKKGLTPEQYGKISTAVSQSVEKEGFLKSVYKGIASPVLNLIARPGQAYQSLTGKEISTGRFAGVNITAPQTGKDVVKDIGRGIQTASMAIPVGTIPRIATAGAGVGLGSALEQGANLKDTIMATLIGGATGAVFGIGTKVVGKGISTLAQKVRQPLAKGVSEVLGRTSDTAPEVIKSAITNPAEFAKAQKEVIKLGNPKVLSNLQEGIRGLRTSLTNYYKVGQQRIADATPDVRVGLNETQERLFNNLADRFGIDLPQNVKSFSSKELLDLNAEINSLYNKKAIREGVEGVIVRKGKDVLENIVNTSFKQFGLDEFLKGYSTQKTTLDAMNELFNAYKTKSPKAVSQAFRNIKAAFQEDKFAYLEAIEAFEKQTGINVLNQLKAMQLRNFFPQQSGKFSFDEIFRLVLLPITSPKLVGIEAKTLGRIINGAQNTGEFIANISGLIQKAQMANIPLNKVGMSIEDVSKNVYKGEKDLTTKILKDLEGKTTVSKQYILDATNRGELKQVERDLVRNMLEGEKDVINVSDFAKKVKAELLPLKSAGRTSRYENITLPSEVRGNVANYKERIYESPVKTSAGDVHFSGSSFRGRQVTEVAPNYFGHTRIEDMADNKTRRVIEVQSDLYQKGGLENEITKKQAFGSKNVMQSKSGKELTKLQQYNDPTAHFRMIREEIKKASQDGKTKLQFPTGETALRIEGIGERKTFTFGGEPIKINELKVGREIKDRTNMGDWTIIEVGEGGQFKAAPTNLLIGTIKQKLPNISGADIISYIKNCL